MQLAGDFGIEQLTVYAFSTENWTRPDTEVSGIMALFVERIRREAPELDEEGVRLRFIGRRDRLSRSVCCEQIEWAEQLTARHTGAHAVRRRSTTAGGPRSCTPPSATRAAARRSSASTSTRPT